MLHLGSGIASSVAYGVRWTGCKPHVNKPRHSTLNVEQ